MQNLVRTVGAIFVLAFLAACANTEPEAPAGANSLPTGEGHGACQVGAPYRIDGHTYYPKADWHYEATGIASWYSPDLNGHLTANGEIYDEAKMTAAHRTLQLPAVVSVTNLANGKSVVVRVNDRGPFVHGRLIELSKRAARRLGFVRAGTARVRVRLLARDTERLWQACQ